MKQIFSHLRITKQILQNNDYKTLTLVLGNESCDLDSAASAIVLAWLLHVECQCAEQSRKDLFIPLLDVDREDMEIKTEINYALSDIGMDSQELFFRDDYDFKELVRKSPTKVMLVDHHILSERNEFLKPYVTGIFDHRPTDARISEYKSTLSCKIEMVGSCATLIAQRCKDSLCTTKEGVSDDFMAYAGLLHSAIMLDTVNFSEVVKKTTPLDIEMAEYLEKIMLIKTDIQTYRTTKLSKLTDAKSDVSKLTAAQLLKKDAKITGRVFLPGFPILVESFLRKPNAVKSIDDALEMNGCIFCVLLGLTTGSQLARDVAVYNTKRHPGAKLISMHLQEWNKPNFQLESTVIRGVTDEFDYYRQMNLSASRKQYIPAIEAYFLIE